MKSQNKKLYPESYDSWSRDPSEQNTELFLKDIRPVIDSALKSYAGGDQAHRTRATIMALQAAKKYDPSKGTQLNTHLMSDLRRLSRTARQRRAVIHVPENVYFNSRRLREAAAEFAELHSREPTDEELADKTGLSVRQIRKIQEYKGGVPSAAFVSEKGDHMQDKARDYYDVWVDHVYHDLDPVDKKIFDHVAGYRGKPIKPKSVIAKELKISPAAVSYRIKNITSKLEEMPTNEIG